MSTYPSLPLFTDAFLADTGHLGAQETGAYLLLLMMAWRLPECALPDDDVKLSRWARVDMRTWARIKAAVMEFWTLEGDLWRQKRLTKERDIVCNRAAVARQNGLRGGRPKPLRNNEPENQAGSSRVTREKAPNPISSLRSESAPAKPTRDGTRLPDDWAPTPEQIAYAVEQGFSEAEARRMAEKFRNHWHATPGQKGRKLDWGKTWCNWVLGDADRQGRKPSSSAAGHAGEPEAWRVMRASDPPGWPAELPPHAVVAKTYLAGHWDAAWGSEPNYGGCRLPPDLQRGLMRERYGADIARRRAPDLFNNAA